MFIKSLTAIAILISAPSQASTSLENDEALLKSLIQRGVICSRLTHKENQESLRIYLSRKSKTSFKNKTTKEEKQKKPPIECIQPK
ncbi:hypothetical protein [Vibrio profundi]|uniref:hypothetical protein n=1 Tax=Vibrio profundi TaxID=1774960 RepID=UPI003736FBF5